MSETLEQLMHNRKRSSMFGDVQKMQYKDFMDVARTVKPYKGTKAYPIGSRRYSHRHFLVTDAGVVQVWHANLKTIEEYRNGLIDIGKDSWSTRRHVVSIHPDNTVEFVNVWGIGDCMFISNLVGGLVHSEARRSGVVYYPNFEVAKCHPVFVGLRVSLTDGSVHPDSQYKMVYRRIIPSKKKEIMARLNAQLEVGFTMLKAMDLKSMKDTFKELHELAKSSEHREGLLTQAIDNNHCVDILAHMTLVDGKYWWFEYSQDEEHFVKKVEHTIEKAKKAYISARPEAFKYIEREPFDFPSASWGLKVKVGDTIIPRV